MSVDGFRNYLQLKGFVVRKQIPYYVRWVSMFLQFCNGHADQATFEQKLDSFLSGIGKRYEQWQIDQAKEAVSLYNFFSGRKSSTTHKKSWDSDADWKKNWRDDEKNAAA